MAETMIVLDDGTPSAALEPASSHTAHVLPLRERLARSESGQAEMFVTASAPFVIIHVSPEWCQLCGWRLEEAVGKNIGLLHGDLTCESALGRLRAALAQGVTTTERLVSYTRHGLPFTNDLMLVPLSLHGEGDVTHFVATLRPSPAPPGAKCSDRAGALRAWLPQQGFAIDKALDDGCRGAAEHMVAQTRSAGRVSISLEDLLDGVMPLLPHQKACALQMLVDAVLQQQMRLTQRAFQMTVQIILEEDVSILHCTAQWMGLLAPELVSPCIAAPAA